MSTQLAILETKLADVQLSQFYGGQTSGTCLQLTPQSGHNYIQLTPFQALMLAELLKLWANEINDKHRPCDPDRVL